MDWLWSFLRNFICGSCEERADLLETENKELRNEVAKLTEQRRHYAAYLVIALTTVLTILVVHNAF